MADEFIKKLVAVGSDGASVMTGCKNGVTAKLKEKDPSQSIIGVHCMAHRLELAFKDTLEGPASTLVDLFLNIYLFYHGSALNRATLLETYEALQERKLVPTRVGGTRWVGHLRQCISNLCRGYNAFTTHLDQVIQGKITFASCNIIIIIFIHEK